MTNLVSEILRCTRNDIEVIVQDNNSTDSTMKLLAEIRDTRLKIFSNDRNIGGPSNGLSVIQKAIGDYVFVILDKDFVNHQRINKFIKFLEKNSYVSAGYCSLSKLRGYEIYKKGVSSVLNFSYACRHPTGHFFSRKVYVTKGCAKYTSEFCEGFALDFIFADILEDNYAVLYHEGMIQNESNEDAALTKSFSYIANENAFYFPKSRTRMSIKFLNHANNLKFEISDKLSIIEAIFYRGLYASSLGFRKLMQDPYFCSHYNLGTQRIKVIYIFYTAIVFYFKFTFALFKINNNFDFIKTLVFLNFSLLRKLVSLK